MPGSSGPIVILCYPIVIHTGDQDLVTSAKANIEQLMLGFGKHLQVTRETHLEFDGQLRTSVIIPWLELKHFDGDVCNWLSFWDQFKAANHDNQGLCEVEKFIYLRISLNVTAINSIKGLALTAINYDAAITILKKTRWEA